MDIEDNQTEAAAPLTDLILSLEQATLMAKQLPTAIDLTQLLRIHSFLHHAHKNLSSFVINNTQYAPPPPPTRAVSDENDSEPMQVGDDNSETGIEERMRDCFIKNKRPKRPLSPASAALVEEKRLHEDAFVRKVNRYDPHRTKMRALDLVYQFHG